MVSITDTEHFCIGHSANHILHGLHGQMFADSGTIEVARIQAHSELVILLLGNHKTLYAGGGLCTFLNDSQLLHSLSSSLRGSGRATWTLCGGFTTGVLDALNLTEALIHVSILGFQVCFEGNKFSSNSASLNQDRTSIQIWMVNIAQSVWNLTRWISLCTHKFGWSCHWVWFDVLRALSAWLCTGVSVWDRLRVEPTTTWKWIYNQAQNLI